MSDSSLTGTCAECSPGRIVKLVAAHPHDPSKGRVCHKHYGMLTSLTGTCPECPPGRIVKLVAAHPHDPSKGRVCHKHYGMLTAARRIKGKRHRG